MGNDIFDSAYDFCSLLPLFYNHDSTIAQPDQEFYNFGIGDICKVPDLHEILTDTINKMFKTTPSLIGRLPGMQGHDGLSSLLANIVENETGLKTQKEDLVLTDGGCDGIVLGAMSACCPGEGLAYAVPSFPYWCVLRGTSIVQCPIAFESPIDYQKQFVKRMIDTLDSNPRIKAFILNEPHNPTGLALYQEDLKKLGQYVTKHNITVLIDDVARGLVHVDSENWWGKHFPEEKMILIDSFTKRFASPGLRLGFVRASDPFKKNIRGYVANFRGGVSNLSAHFGFLLASIMMNSGKIDIVRNEVQRRMLLLRKSLCSNQLNIPEIHVPDWGAYCIISFNGINLKSGFNGHDIVKSLFSKGIKVLDDKMLFPPELQFPRRYNMIRLSIGGEPRVEEGMQLFHRLLKEIIDENIKTPNN